MLRVARTTASMKLRRGVVTQSQGRQWTDREIRLANCGDALLRMVTLGAKRVSGRYLRSKRRRAFKHIGCRAALGWLDL